MNNELAYQEVPETSLVTEPHAPDSPQRRGDPFEAADEYGADDES